MLHPVRKVHFCAQTNLLVEFEPCKKAFRVCVLQSKIPNFTKANGFDDLVEKLFTGGAGLDGKFQLGVHRRHPYIDLNFRKVINTVKLKAHQ